MALVSAYQDGWKGFHDSQSRQCPRGIRMCTCYIHGSYALLSDLLWHNIMLSLVGSVFLVIIYFLFSLWENSDALKLCSFWNYSFLLSSCIRGCGFVRSIKARMGQATLPFPTAVPFFADEKETGTWQAGRQRGGKACMTLQNLRRKTAQGLRKEDVTQRGWDIHGTEYWRQGWKLVE